MSQKPPPSRPRAKQPAALSPALLLLAIAAMGTISGCSPPPLPDPWHGNPPAPYRADRHGHTTAETFAHSLDEFFALEPPLYLAEYTLIEGESRQGDTNILIRSVPKKLSVIHLSAPREGDALISPANLDTFTAAMGVLAPHIAANWLPSSLETLDATQVQLATRGDYSVVVRIDDYEPMVTLNFSYH